MSKVVSKFYNDYPEKEWVRLDQPYQKIEFTSTIKLIKKYFPKKGNVCDIGSGPGRYALELLKQGFHVTLVDISKELIQIAKEKIAEQKYEKSAEFICSDAKDLSYLQSDHFDALLIMGPLYHLLRKADRMKVLKEAYRLLKPQGVAIIAYLNSWGVLRYGLDRFSSLYNDKDFLHRFLGEVIIEGSFENFTECYFSTPSNALQEIENAGFNLISQSGVEGFAGGMKNIICQLAEKHPQAYENVLEMIAETSELKQFRDTAEHIHFIVRKT